MNLHGHTDCVNTHGGKIGAAIVACLVLAACSSSSEASTEASMMELCIASEPLQQQSVDTTAPTNRLLRIEAELALTDGARSLGLMHREHLAEDAGMLFYYPDSQRRSFWMFNTLIPLDIAYLDESGKIMQILTMEPCFSDNPGHCRAYPSDHRARAALEVNAGVFDAHGVSQGDYVLDANCQYEPWAQGW